MLVNGLDGYLPNNWGIFWNSMLWWGVWIVWISYVACGWDKPEKIGLGPSNLTRTWEFLTQSKNWLTHTRPFFCGQVWSTYFTHDPTRLLTLTFFFKKKLVNHSNILNHVNVKWCQPSKGNDYIESNGNQHKFFFLVWSRDNKL